MDIHVYALCYNEEMMLPYFIRHYSKFATHFTFFDNYSTDKSREIMETAPNVSIHSYSSSNQVRDDLMLNIKNNCWKESRGKADWVVVVDIDEFVYYTNMQELLNNAKKMKVTVLQPLGFQMVCEEMPNTDGQIYDQVTRGMPHKDYSKICVFNPNAIREINYVHGCHKANPNGRIVLKRPRDFKLLHFHHLTMEYYVSRCRERGKRLSSLNKKQAWGTEYLKPIHALEMEYREIYKRSSEIIKKRKMLL